MIAELRKLHRVLTGQHVRAELHRRFGIRAGTKRVYRLLRSPPPPPPSIDPSDATYRILALTRERDSALARANLAELRERSTQDRTANEIYELRQEVKRLRQG
jgi:hypothetical protein